MRLHSALFCMTLLAPFSLFAEEATLQVSEACLHSIHDLYKFYYHEIQPNQKLACNTLSENLDEKTVQEMKSVFDELKEHCTTETIAQVNEALKGTSNETEVS